MVSRTELKEDAFDLALGILQVARDPEHGFKHSRHFSPIFKWDLQKEWLNRFSTHPQIQSLVDERFGAPWPSFDDMRAMPIGSLGFCAQPSIARQLGTHVGITVPLIPAPGSRLSRVRGFRSSGPSGHFSL